MERVEILGGCMCGAVRYRLSSEPIYQTMCHCSDCRKSCGAPAVAWVTVGNKDFCFTKGEPKRYQSSVNVVRTFCSVCGTSLTYQRDERKHEMDIKTGSLDEPEKFGPRQDYYCRDRLSWIKPSTDKCVEGGV